MLTGMTLESPAPCQTCGAPARIQKRRGEGSLAEPGGEEILVRVCTDKGCDTNTGNGTLGDVV